jgi:UDP-2,3-diacylglucosamine pyrophosphatase LpxH
MTTTLILSDIHVTTAEPRDPRRPLWKRYKQADFFVDADLARMLAEARATTSGPLELILNGDIFDFDAVTQLPGADEGFAVNWLERLRGLHAAEPKSAWKLRRILDEHPLFVDALRDWLAAGHELVFVVGNHDLELLWPAAQAVLRERLGGAEAGARLRICDWFTLSGGDTLVEHGHQYDAYCAALDPIQPEIRLGPGRRRLRLPFASYAARMMINGMGVFNPYATSGFIMPFQGYVLFFWQHVLPVQPLLPWTWLWSSAAAFWLSVRDGLAPGVKDPVAYDEIVDEVAHRARATPRMVRALHQLRVHPAFFTPWKILQELWLDRLLLLVLLLYGTFQALAVLNVTLSVSMGWWLLVVGVLLPPFLFYARGVRPDVHNLDRALRRRVDLITTVTGVSRVVLGHTHAVRHDRIGDVEVLNPGTWSPAFSDMACTAREDLRAVVWLRPDPARPEGPRRGSVERWLDPGWSREPVTDLEPAPPGVGSPADWLDAELVRRPR